MRSRMQRSSESHPSSHRFSDESDKEQEEDEEEEAAEAEGRGEGGSTTTAMTTTTTGVNIKTFAMSRSDNVLEASWGQRAALLGALWRPGRCRRYYVIGGALPPMCPHCSLVRSATCVSAFGVLVYRAVRVSDESSSIPNKL